MKRFVLALAALSGMAAAQIPGVGEGAGAMIGAGLNSQVPGTALGGVTGTVRAVDDDARDAARDASDRAAAAADARVEARAGLRVAQGTRCYDTRGDFDPSYRDGFYYCERTGPAAAAGAKVKAGD